MNLLIAAAAFGLFCLVMWWQHKRDWREDRAIAAWLESGLVWLDAKVFGLWNAIVAWCMGW